MAKVVNINPVFRLVMGIDYNLLCHHYDKGDLVTKKTIRYYILRCMANF